MREGLHGVRLGIRAGRRRRVGRRSPTELSRAQRGRPYSREGRDRWGTRTLLLLVRTAVGSLPASRVGAPSEDTGLAGAECIPLEITLRLAERAVISPLRKT